METANILNHQNQQTLKHVSIILPGNKYIIFKARNKNCYN